MYNYKKQGFSLIEVMIIFTLLAVILAASMPILTKKSVPIPKRVTHGVYRCIATSTDEGIVEEIYSANRLLSKKENVSKCTFSVPTASLYTVELYGAGAGGTNYAEMTPALADDKDREFTLEDAKSYYEHPGDTSIINQPGSGYQLTDEDIKTAFEGRKVITSEYSANAGDGGTAVAIHNDLRYLTCNYKKDSENPANSITIYSMIMGDNVPPYNSGIKIQPLPAGKPKQYTNFDFQLDSFCKIAYIKEIMPNPVQTLNTIVNIHNVINDKTCKSNEYKEDCYTYIGASITKEAKGGKGGLGNFHILEYTLPKRYDESSELIAKSYSLYGDDEKFKYTRYLGAIYGNKQDSVGRHGYSVGSCASNGGNCNNQKPEGSKIGNYDSTPKGKKEHDYTTGIYEGNYQSGTENFKIVIADAAENVSRKLAWSVPCTANNCPTYKSSTASLATGGKGGSIQVEKTKNWNNFPIIDGNYNFANSDYSWVISNFNTDGSLKPGEDGQDEELSPYDSYNIYKQSKYSLDTNKNKGIFQEPKMIINSKMLEKHYKLGAPGRHGEKKAFKVASLGSSCKIQVSSGGPALQYATLLLEDKTESQIQGIVKEFENNLATTMKCKDGDDIVFDASAKGGTYNTWFDGNSDNNFIWDESITEGEPHYVENFANEIDGYIRTPDPNENESWFSHLFKGVFSKLYNSGILGLDNYSISYGGEGPTLTDKCTAKKGIINIGIITEMKEKYVNRDKNSEDYGKVNKDYSNFYSFYSNIKGLNKKKDGKLNGTECYDTNYGSLVTLISDDELHMRKKEKLIMPDENGKMPNKYYILDPAKSGGGGAVVITW